MIQKLLSGIVIPLFALSASSFAGSQVLLDEDFEGYAGGEGELSAAWPRLGNATTHLAADPKNRRNTVLFSRGDRRTRTFDSVKPTNERPLRVIVNYYDDFKEGAPGREYIGLWAGRADPRAVVEVGLHNHSDRNDSGYYTARVLGDEDGWFDLHTERKAGWRKIQLWVFANTVEIYIDGDLDTVVDWAGGPLSAIRLGGGGFGEGDTASLTGVYYDNIRVERVENPQEEGTLIELTDLSPKRLLLSDPET